ncbi:hypothetical protein BGZ63DRAFT_455663 [Mariannaea sp. PMI_226]|nr:hypothetical protein BGZ63DRAFT_455663 [Mariannaea sp. PMI_226]
MIYRSGDQVVLPSVDLLTFLFDSEHSLSNDETVLHSEAKDPCYGITKAQARSLTEQIAYFLRHNYGIGQSSPNTDFVITLCTGQSALPCLFYGVLAAEGVYSAALPLNTAADISKQIKDVQAEVLVCSDDLQSLAVSAARMAGLADKNVLRLRSYPRVELESVDGSVRCDFSHSLSWRKITDPAELENSKICVLYSSGTTGLPKGVVISHKNLVSQSFLATTVQRQVYVKWMKESRGFASKNLAHLSTGHLSSILLYFVYEFLAGGTVYWMPTFDFDDFMRYMLELEIPLLFTVPRVYTMIAKHPSVTDQFKHVRYAAMGAGPLSRDLHEAASKKLSDISITLSWGLTETTGSVTLAGPEIDHPIGSSSQLLPNIQLRLVDDDGVDVEPGQPGEAIIKGPTVMKAYHNNSEASKMAFTPDGWLRTGDILRVENSLVYMVERKKDLIKYNALQISPTELEMILGTNPAVLDAAVIGRPQDDTEVPCAFVVLAPGWKGKISEVDLITYVSSEVAQYKQLRGGLIFVDAIPRSPIGKVLRKKLREFWEA